MARDTDINVAADLWDGTHPNANGEIRIAAAFADALATKFHLGAAYPTPFPVMPVGPLTHPKLTVTPSQVHGQAKLSWTLVPGANGYYVYSERDDGRPGQVHPAAISAGHHPGSVHRRPAQPRRGLLAFKIQACKGSDCGAFSNVVTITAPLRR